LRMSASGEAIAWDWRRHVYMCEKGTGQVTARRSSGGGPGWRRGHEETSRVSPALVETTAEGYVVPDEHVALKTRRGGAGLAEPAEGVLWIMPGRSRSWKRDESSFHSYIRLVGDACTPVGWATSSLVFSRQEICWIGTKKKNWWACISSRYEVPCALQVLRGSHARGTST